jgi:hypothetical protein
MRAETFEKEILEKTLDEIKKVLGNKAKEYSTHDRLYNFKAAARVLNTSPKKALWGMALKHLISVIDIVEDIRPITPSVINEKIGDLINYLILLKALCFEADLINIEEKGHDLQQEIEKHTESISNVGLNKILSDKEIFINGKPVSIVPMSLKDIKIPEGRYARIRIETSDDPSFGHLKEKKPAKSGKNGKKR